MEINALCKLEAFRKFLILNVCQSFIPKEWMFNKEVFPEKIGEGSIIIIEAKYKELLGIIKNVKFVKAKEILKITYISKSGRTKLTWTKIKNEYGNVSGEASINSIVNLTLAGIIKPIKI